MQKLIIVEDDSMISELYQTIFSGSGFEVFTAENGKRALEILKREKINIVLTDSMMPEMDGFELIETLRNGGFDKNIKIIMLSNLSQKEDQDKAMRLGADGYIVKARFDPDALVAEVKRIINK